MYYFLLQKLEFKQLIVEMAIEKIRVAHDVSLSNVTLSNNLLLDVNFNDPPLS